MTEPSTVQRREEHLACAHRAHDARRFTEAAGHYRAFVDAGGPLHDVGVALGDMLSETGDMEGALTAYAAAVEGDRRNGIAAVRLGQAAQRLGQAALARAAWRLCGAQAHPSLEIPIGGEVPLPEVLDGTSFEVLKARGWPVTPLVEKVRTSHAITGLPMTSPDLGLVALSPLPTPPRPDLVASVRLTAGYGGGATLCRVAEISAEAAAGHAWVIAHLAGAEGGGEAQALRHLIQARCLPATLAMHAAGTSTRAMHNLDLALARGVGADAVIFHEPPHAAGPDFAAAFSDDPLVGFASWTAGGSPPAVEPVAGRGWSYGPVDPGLVTLVRRRVLAEAGLLDAVYEDARMALLDLMLRANRMGFSAVSAQLPKAFPALRGLTPRDGVDRRILDSRYPEHDAALRQASTAPARDAGRLLLGRDRRGSLALDLTGLRAWHDGTSELAVALARALAARGTFRLTAICSAEAAEHHQLAGAGVGLAPPDTREVFAACLKIGQPFTWAELLRTWSYAPVAGFYMLDAISLDVERLNMADLETLWRVAFEHSEVIGHLSAFTRDQMARRFGAAGGRGFVALCSTAADEYGRPLRQGRSDGPILLVGNAYEHKNLLGAVREIHRKDPERELMVLGRVLQARPHVTWLDSGTLNHAELEDLYADAAAIVFPSLYEGFGMPIMHGLARGKAVLAVDSPVFREIQARSAVGANLHLFPTTRALAESLDEVWRGGVRPSVPLVREHRWADAARIVEGAIRDAVDSFTPAALERRTVVAALASAATTQRGSTPERVW